MSLQRRRTLTGVALIMTVAVLSVAACGGTGDGPVEAEPAKLGPQSGLGDDYFPLAGNQGYDVQHYDITLDIDPTVGDLSGTTVVEVKALADLDEFDLDLMGLEVQGVQVDGVAADYQRIDQELIIDPPKTVSAGSIVSVAVTYSGTPQALTSADGYPEGWQHSGDTIFTLDEPEGAATWYPLNDHPSDKATYSFYLTVPEPYVAVANGSWWTPRSTKAGGPTCGRWGSPWRTTWRRWSRGIWCWSNLLPRVVCLSATTSPETWLKWRAPPSRARVG